MQLAVVYIVVALAVAAAVWRAVAAWRGASRRRPGGGAECGAGRCSGCPADCPLARR